MVPTAIPAFDKPSALRLTHEHQANVLRGHFADSIDTVQKENSPKH
jgi:hypothetical protein